MEATHAVPFTRRSCPVSSGCPQPTPLPQPSPTQRPAQGDLQDSSHFAYYPLLRCPGPPLPGPWTLLVTSQLSPGRVADVPDSPHPVTPNSQGQAQPETTVPFSNAKHTSHPWPPGAPSQLEDLTPHLAPAQTTLHLNTCLPAPSPSTLLNPCLVFPLTGSSAPPGLPQTLHRPGLHLEAPYGLESEF